LKRHNLIGWLACVFGLSIFAQSQAIPTASRPGALQVGAGFTYVQPDYAQSNDKGPYFYTSFDFFSHVGLEADIHLASVSAPSDVGEDSYLFGPRFVMHKKRFQPYAKALFGIGVIKLQYDYAPHSTSNHFAYALGGGLDFNATKHINVRCFDFEAQMWDYPPRGLSPYAYTAGVAYVFR
jgi:hypothetical protein